VTLRFREVVGHEPAIARLRRAAADDRPASAYLFTGAPGVGKRTLADAFAARLLCATPAAGDACGTCAQCTRIAAGTHPDLKIVARDEDRRDVRIEQARELTRWLALRPLMARRKVAIVDDADCLNEPGQNALLKTLEEPPGAAVVLLVATRASQLLPTVRSRCQHVRLEPLAPDALAAFLAARGVAADVVPIVVARAGGAPGRALTLVDDPDAELRTVVLDHLARLPTLLAADCSALAQRVGKGDPAPALDVLAAWYRDLLALTLDPATTALRNADAGDALRAAAARTTADAVLRQLEAVCDTARALERNANRVLALETLLLVLRRLARGESLPPTWTTAP
jgi:DNA polymerase-3 subunit delta'